MSKKFIPYIKLSKKAKKEHNRKNRTVWILLKPATRIEQSKYRHKKEKAALEYQLS